MTSSKTSTIQATLMAQNQPRNLADYAWKIEMNTVLVVDDHPPIRVAVKHVLEQNGYEVVGEADNGVAALQLARNLTPDFMILDIGIPQMDGLALIERMKLQNIKTRTLVLTSQPASIFSPRCARSGAAGFISKDRDMSELIGALTAIKAGYSFFPSLPFDNVQNATGSMTLNILTDREIEVLRHLAAGHPQKAIADSLSLSVKTISSYKSRIMEKLNVNNFIELIEVAKRDKII